MKTYPNIKVGTSRHEAMHMFTSDIYSIKQLESIWSLLEILGKYTYVDNKILESRAEKMDKKIGIRAVNLALRDGLIIQAYDPKKDEYYTHLAQGGMYAMEKAQKVYNALYLAARKEERERILTLNHYLLDQDFDLLLGNQDFRNRYFFCTDNKIVHFPETINEKEIIRELQRQAAEYNPKKVPGEKDIRLKYTFIPLKTSYTVSNDTKCVDYKNKNLEVE